MKDVITSVLVLDAEGNQKELAVEELDLGYRHSCIPEKGYVVLSAKLKLVHGDVSQIRAKMAELREQRVTKQPLEYPSAGSTFKRPEGYYASALIDQCGLKGYSIGGARVSEKHAGFLVNTGTSSEDFLRLMHKVQDIVEERAGVRLEPEIRIIGTEK